MQNRTSPTAYKQFERRRLKARQVHRSNCRRAKQKHREGAYA